MNQKLLMIVVAALVMAIPFTCELAHSFTFEQGWKRVDAQNVMVFNDSGKEVPVATATLMKHARTGKSVILYSPFESDELMLSLKVDDLADGFKGEAKPFRLEPDGPEGLYPDFIYRDETSFQVALYSKEGEEIERRTFTRAFKRFVPADEPIDELQCVPGRRVSTQYGQWQEYTVCSERFPWVSWLYPSVPGEPLMKLWIERTAFPEASAAMWCAVRMHNDTWVQTKISHSDNLVWEVLSPLKKGLVSFQAKIVDADGNMLVRRVLR